MSRVELVYFRGSEDERKLMRCAYAMLEREGSARRMFMDGTVRSAEEFEKDLFRPGSLPFLVLHDGHILTEGHPAYVERISAQMPETG